MRVMSRSSRPRSESDRRLYVLNARFAKPSQCVTCGQDTCSRWGTDLCWSGDTAARHGGDERGATTAEQGKTPTAPGWPATCYGRRCLRRTMRLTARLILTFIPVLAFAVAP